MFSSASPRDRQILAREFQKSPQFAEMNELARSDSNILDRHITDFRSYSGSDTAQERATREWIAALVRNINEYAQ